MKPHIPLILLSALLALMPAKAEEPLYSPPYNECLFWVASNHPKHPLAFILNTSQYTQIPYTKFVPGAELNIDNVAAQMDFFFKSASGVHLTAASIFNTWGYGFHMDSSTLDATLGSIMFTEAELANVTLNTKCDNATSDEWGLPQVALMQASFLEGTTTVNSNFFTVNYWNATGNQTFDLNKTFGSFRYGHSSESVTILSDKGVEIKQLTIDDGSLVINRSSSDESDDWLVDLWNVSADNGVQVNAESNQGRIEVGVLTTSGPHSRNSFLADEVNINSEIKSASLSVYAGNSATLRDVDASEYLRVDAIEGTCPNITFAGSLIAKESMALIGKAIYGTAPGAVISSGSYMIDATGEVKIQGTFQGGDLTLTAGGAVSLGNVGTLQNPLGSAKITGTADKPVAMESFLGDTLTIEAGGAITLESIGSLEKTVNSAVITGTSAAPVTVKSFHGGESGTLKIDSYGVVTIGAQTEQGQGTGIPVYEGNVTVNYLGEGGGEQPWHVAMLGEVKGSLTVNAELGGVNAGHITGRGNISAKQIYVSSFGEGDLLLKANESVTVEGNIENAGTLTIGQLNGTSADIIFQTAEKIEAKSIIMQGNDITCSGERLVISAESYQIEALGEVSIAGTVQGGNISMKAGGDIALGWVENSPSESSGAVARLKSAEGSITMQSFEGDALLAIAGKAVDIKNDVVASGGFALDEKDPETLYSAFLEGASVSIQGSLSTCTNKVYIKASGNGETDTGITVIQDLGSSESIILDSAKDISIGGEVNGSLSATAGGTFSVNKASLSKSIVKAHKVTFADELTLQDQSSITGDVTAFQSNAKLTVEDSTIADAVSGVETVNLTRSTIGSLKEFSTLEVQEASKIASDLVVDDGAMLSFVLNLEKRTTPVLTIGGELKVDNPDNPKFTIELVGNNLPVLEKFALISTAKGQAPEFWKPDSVTLSGLSSDEKTLFWEGNTLYFSLGGPELKVATWTGEASSLWNKKDVNWKQQDKSYLYEDGVAVVFNDEGKAGEEGKVELVGDLKPGSVLVKNSEGHDYTFAGEGALTGKTVLVKQGTGTLTVNTANDYTGGTTISGGTLVMGNGNAFGSGDVKLGDATLNLAGHTLYNNVSVTGENAYLGNGTLVGKLNVEDGRKLTLSGKLEGESTITLGREATLDLGGNTLSPQVKLTGNATIGNGEIIMGLTVEAGRTLTLGGYLKGSGTISLGTGSTLDLSGKTLSNGVELTGDAYLNTGVLNGNVEVGEAHKLTLRGALFLGSGVVHLGNGSTLDLNSFIFSKAVTITGNASICNGLLNGNTLTVEEGGKLTLGNRNVDTAGNLTLSLGGKAAANLGGNTLSGTVKLGGDASIGNGTLNADVAVGAGNTLTLCDGDLGGEGVIRLANLSMLDLGGKTLAKAAVLDGCAYTGNGTLDADLTVGAGYTLTLTNDLEGRGTIILNEGSVLDTVWEGPNPNILYNAVEVAGNASIHGTFSGKIAVDDGKKLAFQSGTTAAGGIILGHGTTLDLGSNSIDSSITLAGDAAIGNGTVNADVTVGAGYKLSVTSDLEGNGAIILNENSSLDTHGDEVYPYILNNAVKVAGDASIHGTFYGKIAVDAGRRLEFKNGTTAAGGIDLAQGSELDLDGNQTSTAINLAGDATIGSGTINNGSLAVAEEKTLTLRGNVGGTRTISLDIGSSLRLTNDTSVANKITGGSSATIVQTGNESATLTGDLSGFTGNVTVESRGVLNIINADSMDNVTVDVTLGRRAILGVYNDANAVEASEGSLTISGDHRLAAAFHAQLNANLVMKSGSVLDVSATGGESGGLHMGSTVTLDPGNVLLSEADMAAVNGLRYMQAYDLFSGVDRLSLGNGANFLEELGLSDPWVKAADVFGNDLFKSAEKEYYLFYSGKNQGGAVGYEGTVYLMRLPEPTTGTLSLLALAALAARRRRK